MTTAAYAASGAIVGASAFPSALLLAWAARTRLAGCCIGAHSVICAGATVGIHSFLRKGARVAPGAHVAAVGALPPRETLGLERGGAGRQVARPAVQGPGAAAGQALKSFFTSRASASPSAR